MTPLQLSCQSEGGITVPFHPSRGRAFTLVEVLIAITVISISLLGTVAALTYSVRGSSLAGRNTQALNYARETIELIRVKNLAYQPAAPPAANSNLNDGPTIRRDLNATPLTTLPAGTPFRRNIQIRRVANSASDYRYEEMEITVTIYWFDHQAERKVVQVSHLNRI